MKTWVYLRLRLARPCVHLRWLAITLVEIKFARKSKQVFHRLATQPKSLRKFNLPLLASPFYQARWLSIISYPTRARGIIVNYTDSEMQMNLERKQNQRKEADLSCSSVNDSILASFSCRAKQGLKGLFNILKWLCLMILSFLLYFCPTTMISPILVSYFHTFSCSFKLSKACISNWCHYF